MKHIKLWIFLTFSCLLFNMTCNHSINSEFSPYAGTWRWVKTTGGFAGQTTTPGDKLTIEIKEDNAHTFTLFRNDSLKVLADYTIESANNGYDKISYSHIIVYDDTFELNTEYIQIQSDSLIFWDGQMDGYFRFFVRD